MILLESSGLDSRNNHSLDGTTSLLMEVTGLPSGSINGLTILLFVYYVACGVVRQMRDVLIIVV